MEKRRFARIGIRLGGNIEFAGPVKHAARRTELAGQVQSVSPQGIGFQLAASGRPELATELEQGKRVRVRFDLGETRLELPVSVVYTRGPNDAPYVGLRVDLELAAAADRQRYVAWVVDLLRSAAA